MLSKISPPPPLTIRLQSDLPLLWLACCPHCCCCPCWGCSRMGVLPLPPQPPQFPPQLWHSSQTTSVTLGFMSAIMSLYVLVVGRLGWITLDPTCIPVPVYQLSVLSLTTMSAPLARLPGLSWVVALTYTTLALPLLSVWSSPTDSTRSLKGTRLLSR